MQRLKQTQIIIDAEFNTMSKIASVLFSNPEFKTTKTNETVMKKMNRQEEMKKNIVLDEFIEDFYLYDENTNTMLSSTSLFTLEDFFTHGIYTFDDNTQEEILKGIDSKSITFISSRLISGINDNSEKMFCIFPENKTITQKRAVIFILNSAFIKNMYKDQGNLILSYNNQVLIDTGNNDIETQNKLLKHSASSDISELDNTLILSIEASYTNIVYTGYHTLYNAMKKLVSTQIIFIAFTVILALLGVAVILYALKRNYAPIKELKDFAKSNLDIEINDEDELTIAKKAIDILGEKKTILMQRIEDSKPATQNFLLGQIINGTMTDSKLIVSSAESCDLNISNSKYAILAINYKNNFVNIENVVENHYSYVYKTNDPKLVLVIARSDQLDALIVRLWDFFEKELIIATIGVGEVHPINELWRSYTEAKTALDSSLIFGTGIVIYYEQTLQGNFSSNEYPTKNIENLKKLLQDGSFKEVDNELNNIINHIISTQLPVSTVRCICFEIVTILINMVNQSNIEFTSDFTINTFMKFDTVEELASIVKNFFSLHIEQLKTEYNKEETEFSKIISFINNNFYTINFSIKSVADYFNISQQALIQMFKDNRNQTVSEYVTYLQIDKSKRLLKETDMPLQQIVNSVGHSDVSNFIRKFKNIVGITPGEYRKQFRN